MLQAILLDWGTLKRIKAVDDIIRHGFFDSEFESQFVSNLEAEAKPDGFFRQIVLPNGRPGFLARFGADGGRWQIETHVLARRLGIPVDTEIDFLFNPVGQPGVKPIAVYLDGWAFHEDRIAADVEKRLGLIRSGLLEVYSLTWSDFEAKASSEKQYADFSVDPNLKAALKSRLNVHADVVAFEALLDKNPVQFFVSGSRGQSNTTPRPANFGSSQVDLLAS
jgi:DEAD/DEAH box helicase domain-containing protein